MALQELNPFGTGAVAYLTNQMTFQKCVGRVLTMSAVNASINFSRLNATVFGFKY